MEVVVYFLTFCFFGTFVIYGLYALMVKAVKDGIKEYEREKQIKAKKEAAKAAETKKEREDGTEIE